MLNFCTLFDSNYLSRGLAMYESLSMHCAGFRLFIFAFDDACLEILRKLNLPNVTLVPLSEFETKELLEVKKSRTRAEYCWTCTSATIRHVLDRFGVDSCTYVDSDIYWFGPPERLFEELGDGSMIITEHRYTDNRYGRRAIKNSGIYCVQFVTFKNDARGREALDWWHERCLEWCYARSEDGKFGDQKYLDDWTTRFKGVHVLQNLGGGVAPWNVQQYDIVEKNYALCGIEKKSGGLFRVIFYHFHYLRFFDDKTVELGIYDLSDDVRALIYKPYIRHLFEIKEKISGLNPAIDPNGTNKRTWSPKDYYELVKRKIKGNYNVHDLNEFIRQ